jgi:hypothetical protein
MITSEANAVRAMQPITGKRSSKRIANASTAARFARFVSATQIKIVAHQAKHRIAASNCCSDLLNSLRKGSVGLVIKNGLARVASSRLMIDGVFKINPNDFVEPLPCADVLVMLGK